MAQLPLHGGKAPPWLFRRMTKLAAAVTMAIVDEYGPNEMLQRLADPWWFQAFGCVLGFDWHSSGVTTVTCGALKEAYHDVGADLGIIVAGGKGGTSRKTPQEIDAAANQYGISGGDKLVYASRMSAKVDSAALQDGFQVYHHSFFLTPAGQWCVVQQGMNEEQKAARRYHWLGESVDDFVCEPHAAIQDVHGGEKGDGSLFQSWTGPDCHAAQKDSRPLFLNMVAAEAEANRQASAVLVRERPDWLMEEVKRCTEGPTLFAPARHRVLDIDVNRARLRKIVIAAHEAHPRDFETLLGTAGVGPSTIRALALLAELIYQVPASRRDPAHEPPPTTLDRGTPDTAAAHATERTMRRWADYSYAHGGKDGTPFPVDRDTYDRSIDVLTQAVRKARLGENERIDALRRLAATRTH
jgi:hypothetical protein